MKNSSSMRCRQLYCPLLYATRASSSSMRPFTSFIDPLHFISSSSSFFIHLLETCSFFKSQSINYHHNLLLDICFFNASIFILKYFPEKIQIIKLNNCNVDCQLILFLLAVIYTENSSQRLHPRHHA